MQTGWHGNNTLMILVPLIVWVVARVGVSVICSGTWERG
jgi:hypothetical protein